MTRKLPIFVLAGSLCASASEAAPRIALRPEMFSLGSGSTGDPRQLADEQALVGDPLAGQASDPVSTWMSTNGTHLNVAYLDLGSTHRLTNLSFYDRNGVAAFRVYDDLSGALLFEDDLNLYQVWKHRALDVVTRRLRFENGTGYARVPEIVLYGESDVDGGPALGEYKVTEHTTSGHRTLACDLSACDRIISSITGQVVLSSLSGTSRVEPGDRICLQGGGPPFTGRVKLLDVRGTAENPVEITNCGGQVVFSDVHEPILAERSVHFRVLGNGHPSALYGFRLVRSTDAGVKVRYFSRDFEIAWIQFDEGQGVAVKAKSEMKGNDLVTGQPFVQTGTHIHHLRSNHTKDNEAFYIGNTRCEAGDPVEAFPDAPLRDVFVHDNILLDSGADALQVGCAYGDVQIYRNYIKGAGSRPFNNDLQQRHGIQLGKSSTGRIFQNWVEDTAIDCVHAEGGHPDGMAIYNNVFKSCPQAVYLNTRLRYASEVVFSNNTFVGSTGYGIRSSSTHKTSSTQFRIHNNLFVGTFEDSVLIFDNETTPRPLDRLNVLDASSQLYFAAASEPGFVDGPALDYRLRRTSPARDTGTNTSALGVHVDLRGVPRDSAYDVGAFEYVP